MIGTLIGIFIIFVIVSSILIFEFHLLPFQTEASSGNCTWQQISFGKFPLAINATGLNIRNIEFIMASTFVSQNHARYIYDINITNAVQVDADQWLFYGTAIACI